ncbi:LCP family protein [Acidaminobacter hydrogenoformans]|uniref:Transcriptional attenuator, LytR family n=1 Tax=Acidaminobacter hydrogenoformans DSM 2784 TaxID=1120920 RepID=A0A1G5RRU7_9FIRM|nr:LCP family protein [Acidaminobacter hydrogenoformans]SCZ76151.1 transcriptional attenuator, LytR family [Acidaminobacter hydrogenoformans DSM 2784]
MKYYVKVFFIAFIAFSIIFAGGIYAYQKFYENQDGQVKDPANPEDPVQEEPSNELEKMVKEGKRINVLLIGVDGGRSDTLMMLSYDPKHKLGNIVSVPRDTYFHVEGKDAADLRKINAIYGFKGDDGGAEGVAKAVSAILGVPVHHYVKLDYKAVEAVVDVVGGLELDVPFDMNYDDPYADPPLHIHFEAGVQTLDGEEAVEYLRWRKNNGSEGQGDLPRIERQQEFVVTLAKKAMGLKLPMVIKTVFDYLETDMNLGDMIYLTSVGIGVDFSKLESVTIPGDVGMKNGGSYLFHDPEETYELMKGIYERTPESDAKAAAEAAAEAEADGND